MQLYSVIICACNIYAHPFATPIFICGIHLCAYMLGGLPTQHSVFILTILQAASAAMYLDTCIVLLHLVCGDNQWHRLYSYHIMDYMLGTGMW